MRVALIILALACLPASISQAQPWPAAPPRIGQLSMPQNYWDWTLEAAREHGVSPYVIQGFMAIESRYDPVATSGRGRCIGLMQLDRGVARGLGVDPWNPREHPRRRSGPGRPPEKASGEPGPGGAGLQRPRLPPGLCA